MALQDQALRGSDGSGGDATSATGASAGKRSRTEGLPAVQCKPVEGGTGGGDMDVAMAGFGGTPTAYPHRATIEQSFGVSFGGTAYADDLAGSSSKSLGAQGYAVGDQVAFASPNPSLFVAAHEAAHVVQAQGGVHRSAPGGGGGDPLEAHADAVAAGVVRGDFVGDLLASSPTAQLGIHRFPDGGDENMCTPAKPDGAPEGGMSLAPAASANQCTEAEATAQCNAALQTCMTEIDQCLPAQAEAPPVANFGPVCLLVASSKPLNEALAEMMDMEGMTAAQKSAVWTKVQQGMASSYGKLYDKVGALQRVIYQLLTNCENFDKAGGYLAMAATSMRQHMVPALTDALTRLHTQLKAEIVKAAVDAVQAALGRTVPCLDDNVRATVDNVLPQTAFGPPDFATGTTREVRFRATTQFSAYRTAVQTALQTIAGTTFKPIITADATGLHMEMLTDADHTTRMAGAGNKLDANHLHLDGANAADTQSMAWDVYQMQTTSQMGNELVTGMVNGTGQNFDIVMHAVASSPDVDYDAFINNQVDLGDIHGEKVEPAAGTSTHPQSQESVYAHFLYERQYDATHAATDMTVIAAQQNALETQRLALVAEQAALPARILTVLGGGAVAPPLTAAETATATAFVAKANAWTTAKNANDAAFNARFNPAHSHGIDQENAYNRERGFDDTRPH